MIDRTAALGRNEPLANVGSRPKAVIPATC